MANGQQSTVLRRGLQGKQSSDGAEEERGPCFAFLCVRVREKLQPSVLSDASFMCSAMVKLVVQALCIPIFSSPRCSTWDLPPAHPLHVLSVELESLCLKVRGG